MTHAKNLKTGDDIYNALKSLLESVDESTCDHIAALAAFTTFTTIGMHAVGMSEERAVEFFTKVFRGDGTKASEDSRLLLVQDLSSIINPPTIETPYELFNAVKNTVMKADKGEINIKDVIAVLTQFMVRVADTAGIERPIIDGMADIVWKALEKEKKEEKAAN